MTWASDGTRHNLPKRIVHFVRERDNDRCQLAYDGCTGWYQHIDHKQNLAALGIARTDPRAHDPNDLQCVCDWCHNIKTQSEARRGSKARMPSYRESRYGGYT